MNDEQHGGLAPLDVADLLGGPEAIAAYLDAVAELNDPAAFVPAVGHAARAYGMTEITARAGVGRAYGMTEITARAGVGRERLSKSLSPSTHPRFDTIAKVLEAMWVRISIALSQGAG